MKNFILQFIKWSSKLLETCKTGPADREFVYLVGNSHAQHIIPMLHVASGQIEIAYSALTISNCRMTSGLQVMPAINYQFDLCKRYFDEIVAYIRENAEKGDIVLFGARSFFDKPAAKEGVLPSNVYVGNKRLTQLEAYKKSVQEIASFIKDMNGKGVSIIFAGPTPEFESTAVQCVEEWFRVNRDGCSVSVDSVNKKRKNYLEFLSDLGEGFPFVCFWDPLPSICDGQVCRVVRNNKLMFRDKHHLSTFGSNALADSFVDLTNLIRGKSS